VNVRMDFVHDGQETIHYLKGENGFSNRNAHPMPFLLLLDLKMPKLDGFDVLRWVKTQPVLKRLLVTVLTSSTEPSDVNRAYDLGANSYLVKPAVAESLVDIVKKIESYWIKANCPADCDSEI
jgi:CheY-like chemotaxis protein